MKRSERAPVPNSLSRITQWSWGWVGRAREPYIGEEWIDIDCTDSFNMRMHVSRNAAPNMSSMIARRCGAVFLRHRVSYHVLRLIRTSTLPASSLSHLFVYTRWAEISATGADFANNCKSPLPIRRCTLCTPTLASHHQSLHHFAVRI